MQTNVGVGGREPCPMTVLSGILTSLTNVVQRHSSAVLMSSGREQERSRNATKRAKVTIEEKPDTWFFAPV